MLVTPNSQLDTWQMMERTFFPETSERTPLLQPQKKVVQLHEMKGVTLEIVILIRSHLGRELYDERVQVLDIAGRVFIHIGTTHHQSVFDALALKLIPFGKEKRLICFHEGVARNEIEEAKLIGENLGFNFGLEEPNQVIGQIVIFYQRFFTPQYPINPAEHLHSILKTDSFFSPTMSGLWTSIIRKGKQHNCKPLADAIFACFLNIALKKEIDPTVFNSFSHEVFQEFYWVMAWCALKTDHLYLKLSDKAKQVADLWLDLPFSKKMYIPEIVVLEVCHSQRDPVWAENVAATLRKLPNLPANLPVVSKVGHKHLSSGFTEELLKRVSPPLKGRIRWPDFFVAGTPKKAVNPWEPLIESLMPLHTLMDWEVPLSSETTSLHLNDFNPKMMGLRFNDLTFIL